MELTMTIACTPGEPTEATRLTGEVNWAGAQRNVIQGGDLSAHVELSKLRKLRHLYAVGPLEGLVGEVTIIARRPYIAKVVRKQLVVTEDWAVGACFLAYADVPSWRRFRLPKGVSNLGELEAALPRIARAAGIDTLKPFPFLIEGQATSVVFHILNRTDDRPHDEERHEAIKVRYEQKDTWGRAIGFYSENHCGVFIPKGKRVHVHFVDDDAVASGHVDEITFGPNVYLKLPGSSRTV
jgi:acetolactate decarboxylase